MGISIPPTGVKLASEVGQHRVPAMRHPSQVSMMNHRRVLLSLAAGVALAACSDSTAPGYRLPAPDTSLDSTRIRIGQVLYRCEEWIQPQPEGSVVVDIFFGRRGPEDPGDRPLAEHLETIRDEGGEPLVSFNFPAVRAYLPASAIPAVHAAWPGSSIHLVPDERRYDWRGTVVLDGPIEDADEARIAAVGGRVIDRLENLNMIRAELPNSAFPKLRAEPGVLLVEASGQVCGVD